MTVKDLINKIQKVDYLSKEEKQRWISLIPKMDIKELEELAGIVLETEKEKERMTNIRDFMLGGMTAAFTAINEGIIKHTEENSKK